MAGNNYSINPFYRAFGIAASDPGMRHFPDGLPIPPIAQIEGLGLGMNLSWITSWAGAYVFSNLMYNAGRPDQAYGATPFTTRQGLITTTSTIDKFRFVLADSHKYLNGNIGVYTVLNPSRQIICIGGWNTPPDGSFTDAAEFTFELSEPLESGVLALWVKGSLSNEDGNVAVILPGHREKWLVGNVWNQQFLDFYNDMNLPLVRGMDWTNASGNIEQDWEDRVLTNYPTLRSNYGDMSLVPYEFFCDLATRIRAEVWVCIPHRATPAYITEFAKFFAANYPTQKKLWVEYANEVWNYAYPWNLGSRWVQHLNHTRYTATTDSVTGVCTKEAHGLITGESIIAHPTVHQRANKLIPHWQLTTGSTIYVKVLSVDTFEIYTESGLTTKINIVDKQIDILYHRTVESGKLVHLNTNYSNHLINIWDLLETEISPTRLKRIVGSQSANSNITAERIAVPGIIDRGDVLAIAPYFDGVWWGVQASCSSGQILPKVWSVKTASVHIALYPQLAPGETISNKDIIAGTGAISKQVLSYVAGANTYTNAVPFTGLVDGVVYEVLFLFLEDPMTRVLQVQATPAVTPTNVFAQPNYVEQAMSQEVSAENNTNTYNAHTNIITAASGSEGLLDVIAYEGGIHYHQGSPAEMGVWLKAYLESPEFAGITERYLMRMASKGMKFYCHYGDSLGTSFQIANGYHDVLDNRYQVFKRLNGLAPKRPESFLITPAFEPVLTQPEMPHILVSYPPEPGIVYSILKGNADGNFRFDGLDLVLDNDVGVDWNKPKVLNLTIHKRDAYLSATGVIQTVLGDAWYESDALFAWSPIGTVSTDSMIPDVGSVMPKGTALGATISGDLWKFNSDAAYSSNTAMLTTASFSKGFLVACVLDLDGYTDWYKQLMRFGDGNFLSYYFASNVSFEIYSWLGTAGPELVFANGYPAPGKHVYWVFYDPTVATFYLGVDQDVVKTVVNNRNTQTLAPKLVVGSHSVTEPVSKAKHGSMQVVNRTGISLAECKTIVARMTIHHDV